MEGELFFTCEPGNERIRRTGWPDKKTADFLFDLLGRLLTSVLGHFLPFWGDLKKIKLIVRLA